MLPGAPEAEGAFNHWWATFSSFLTAVQRAIQAENRQAEFDTRGILVTFLSHEISTPLKGEVTYELLVAELIQEKNKPRQNKYISLLVYARRMLATRLQKSCENMSDYVSTWCGMLWSTVFNPV